MARHPWPILERHIKVRTPIDLRIEFCIVLARDIPPKWLDTHDYSLKNAITIKQPSWELSIPDVGLSLWLGRTSYAGRVQHRSQVWLETYELQLMKRTNWRKLFRCWNFSVSI